MIREKLSAWEYRIVVKKASQIDPEKTISVDDGFHCPRCKDRMEQPDPTRKFFVCRKCEVRATVWGDIMDCEMGPEPCDGEKAAEHYSKMLQMVQDDLGGLK